MPGCLAGGRGRATTTALQVQWSVQYIIILLSHCISFCFPVLRIRSAALFRYHVRRHQERRFRARADGGGAGSDGGAVAFGRVVAALAAVERHDVHERRVRAGHQGDERDQHDGHVLGHGPTAHAPAAAPRRPAAAPPPLWLPLHRLQVRVVVHRVIVAVKVQVVLRVGRVVRVLAVLVAVVPESGQMDDGRTHQAQY